MKVLKHTALALAAAAALLAGCASDVKLDKDVAVESRTPTPVNPGANAGNAGAATAQSQVASVDLGKGKADTAADKLPRVVYFDFDSYVVKDEFRPTIDAHAKLLAVNRKKHMTIEGHTDERGGREYNLALGQKRAEAVVKSLELLGATESQLEAVSFGKERPVAPGSDEASWALNRRAELKDR